MDSTTRMSVVMVFKHTVLITSWHASERLGGSRAAKAPPLRDSSKSCPTALRLHSKSCTFCCITSRRTTFTIDHYRPHPPAQRPPTRPTTARSKPAWEARAAQLGRGHCSRAPASPHKPGRPMGPLSWELLPPGTAARRHKRWWFPPSSSPRYLMKRPGHLVSQPTYSSRPAVPTTASNTRACRPSVTTL